jgi:uncharacterized protein HemX
MLKQGKTVKTLAASAALIAALGLGAILGSPGVAQAQEDTTTTAVEDTTDATTATTVAEDSGDDTTTSDSESSDRPARGDENCDRADGETESSATT